ncbi:MAG: DUF1365 domain-containing protein [Holophagales bacterium]|nr:DUF1365 domain-containing protein [Holophagales bacterium]
MGSEPDTSSPEPTTRSAIYVGRVRHRRFSPRAHAFEYRLFMTYLDLGEAEQILDASWLGSTRRPAPVRFRRRDYLGDPGSSLDEAVRREVERQSGRRPDGPIRMLTHLRSFGVSFNPVSFYYCFGDDGRTVEHVVAEITNTPWGERHCYVLSEPVERRGEVSTFQLAKDFHVSPFMPMDQAYRWRFSNPGDRLLVHMESFSRAGSDADEAGRNPGGSNLPGTDRRREGAGRPGVPIRASGPKLFDATLSLERRQPLTPRSLVAQHLRYPALPAMVLLRIYRQALALWHKRIPFHIHPRKLARSGDLGTGTSEVGRDHASARVEG